jgi:hypothetical protein
MSENNKTYRVKIVRDKDGLIAEDMGPFSEREAKKVQGGAMINTNHDEWSVIIVECVA